MVNRSNTVWLLICVLLLVVLTPLQSKATMRSEPEERSRLNNTQAYHLTGESLAHAIRLSHTRATLYFTERAWTLGSILILLMLGVPQALRDQVLRMTSKRWLQGLLFVIPCAVALRLLALPIDEYRHYIEVQYGLSVQHWSSWFGEQVILLVLYAVISYPVVMIFNLMVRKFQRTWWLWLWIAAVPTAIFSIFIGPILVAPMFNHFTQLTQIDPSLAEQLERVANRGDLHIPLDRIYLMKASAKTTQINAYVAGIGPSKRIVVWDTAIRQGKPDQVLFIFGHEMGHYALHHAWWGIGFYLILLLVVLYVACCLIHWSVRRLGERLNIPSAYDWAAIAVFLLVFHALACLTDPVTNAFSRWEEHQADVYGQEVIHGIVADPRVTALATFQVYGETSLSDPNLHPVIEFLTASHPAIARRSAFAAAYDPWQAGQQPRFFPKARLGGNPSTVPEGQ